MKSLYKGCFILFLILWSTIGSTVQGQSKIEITGKVVDQQSKNPIEFATVFIADKESGEAITGTTTIQDGSFSMFTKKQNFYVEVSFIGFQKKRIEKYTVAGEKIDLGTIALQPDLESLDEITIRAEKSQTEFKLDKRVFNVGKDLSTAGASALEVLNNVPSVDVSIEGAVSLRGNAGVQILINGKPSVMTSGTSNTLGTITAEAIEKVEVITNPSAKYDAEGTSGIINIVLKKNKKRGLNGSVTLNGGIPDNHSIGLSLNKRTEKFNLFSQFGVGIREMPQDFRRSITNNIDATTINRVGDSEKREQFYNVVLGADYHINDLNVITLSGHYAYEIEDETSDATFNTTEATGNLVSSLLRNEDTEATNPKWQYELQYKKDFEDHEDHSFLISAIGSYFGKDQESIFEDSRISGNVTEALQRVGTDFEELENTFQADYVHPFGEKHIIETGAKYELSDISNDYAIENFTGSAFEVDPNLSNIFSFNQKVLGGYMTYGYEGDKFGIKGGLRVEHTDLTTELENTSETNDQDYVNWFPSAHTSYKFTENFSLQMGYSRRIFRPRLWHLNPFQSIRDNFNRSEGNPNLQPEFTDAFELTSLHKIGKASVNWGVYHRRTKDVIERVVRFENDLYINAPQNIGKNNSTGVELNAKYQPLSWMTLTTDLNWFYFDRIGSYQGTSFDFSSDQWTARATSKIKLPWNFDTQISMRYRSEQETVQSVIADNFFMDLGVKKKILKGRGVLNLSIRDVFASRRFSSVNDQLDFNITNYQKSGRFVVLGFSYGFGKGEAMEFSGHKRF
ncbi:TonB-dependent receptor [Aquimarina rhabdastrellae]